MAQDIGSGAMLKIGETAETPWLEPWTALSRPHEGDWLVLRGPGEAEDDLSHITSAAVAKLVAATPRLVRELCQLEVAHVFPGDDAIRPAQKYPGVDPAVRVHGCIRCHAASLFLHERWKEERDDRSGYAVAGPSRFFTFEGTMGHGLGCPLHLCLNDAGLTSYEDRRRVRAAYLL